MIFTLGQIVATPNALNKISSEDISKSLQRHGLGDWGDMDKQDKKSNDEALKHGGRIFSAYISNKGIKFWIITESDRSVTTILMPEDY